MRNSFNLLLIGLACFDNLFLLFNILETFRSTFKVRVTINKELKCVIAYPFIIKAFECSVNSNIQPTTRTLRITKLYGMQHLFNNKIFMVILYNEILSNLSTYTSCCFHIFFIRVWPSP